MKHGHMHGDTVALQRSDEPVDGIGHSPTMEASPALGNALAPKSKGGRRRGKHGHGGAHGGVAVDSRRWTRVLPPARPALAKGQQLLHPQGLATTEW